MEITIDNLLSMVNLKLAVFLSAIIHADVRCQAYRSDLAAWPNAVIALRIFAS